MYTVLLCFSPSALGREKIKKNVFPSSCFSTFENNIHCERGLCFGVVDFQPVALSTGNGGSSLCCRRWQRAPPHRAPPCRPLVLCSPRRRVGMLAPDDLPLLVVPTFPELCWEKISTILFLKDSCTTQRSRELRADTEIVALKKKS